MDMRNRLEELRDLIEENANLEAIDAVEAILDDTEQQEANDEAPASPQRDAPGSPWPGWTPAPDVADALGVSGRTVRRWAEEIHASGQPFATRTGVRFTAVRRSAVGRWFFATEEVRAAARDVRQVHGRGQSGHADKRPTKRKRRV